MCIGVGAKIKFKRKILPGAFYIQKNDSTLKFII